MLYFNKIVNVTFFIYSSLQLINKVITLP